MLVKSWIEIPICCLEKREIFSISKMDSLQRQRRCFSTILWIVVLVVFWFVGLVRADPPNAINDFAVTRQSQAITIPVLVNDSDTETNQLTILQVSAPAHGTLVINSNTPVTTPELPRLFQFAAVQLSNTVVQLGSTNLYPRSTQTNGSWNTVNDNDWTSGFFPGCLWYLYEQNGDTNFEKWA